MPWATVPLDFSTITLPFMVNAAVLQEQIHDKLVVLGVHSHTGGSGEGSAALTPTSITLGAGMFRQTKGADVPSASPLALPDPPLGNYFVVTGIVGFASITPTNIQAGTVIYLVFQSSLTVVHNATTMILQTGVDWVVPAGALLMLISEGGGNWREVTRWDPVAQSDLTPSSITMSGPIYQSKGANVASAASAALTTDGDVFTVTGAVQIERFTIRQAGSTVTLLFTGAPTINHLGGGSGQLYLAGSVPYVASAGSVLTLVSDGAAWRETGRVDP